VEVTEEDYPWLSIEQIKSVSRSKSENRLTHGVGYRRIAKASKGKVLYYFRVSPDWASWRLIRAEAQNCVGVVSILIKQRGRLY
jgi:hypothetical protein